MDYMPVLDAATQEVTLDRSAPVLLDTISAIRPLRTVRAPHDVRRFRGLVVDLVTGDAQWRSEHIPMGKPERELLAALMRCAGQFISRAQLAAHLRITPAQVDQRADALCAALRAAGAGCRPHYAEGVGYILWL
ncbi:MAG: hypothetical protein ABI068_10095 [Ktedonobacterales bacterium]